MCRNLWTSEPVNAYDFSSIDGISVKIPNLSRGWNKAMPQGSRKRLILFTRYPQPGTTKTRMIPKLGAEGAAELNREIRAILGWNFQAVLLPRRQDRQVFKSEKHFSDETQCAAAI